MARQLLCYNAPIQVSDAANTAGANVERDGNGDIFVNGLNAATYAKLAGLLLTGAVYTTTVTIPTNITVVKLDATAAAFNATLPPVATSVGQFYLLIKTDASANIPTIKGNAAEVIQAPGASGNTYAQLTAQGSMALIWTDGVKWFAAKLS